ncbi:hypothetical protein LZ24_01028 [Desulfobotulus alkaliphilus]|uniref:Outer membrane protein with beta-barrel domain n=1 Tax=Desulfobotulus alkaliphilus TaxID=622671 RepID=A0A562RZ68_9BACT|nr:hypothetical protein [Desulfobotulus alkaliphilus]TWI74422.1 hypothetical protein LZ24_01028 [Desulfobotulus alkaliphilus]
MSIAIGILSSYNDGYLYDYNRYSGFKLYKVKAYTQELRMGVKKIWEPGSHVRPFIGGGVALFRAELEAEASNGMKHSEDDTGYGIWLSGGVYWTLGSSFNIGFELGGSSGKVTVGNEDIDAGGGHFGLLLGYHW